MLDWLSSFGDFFSSIISFILDFFKEVILIITLLGKAILYATTVVNFMPTIYRVPLITLLSVAIIVTISHFGE